MHSLIANALSDIDIVLTQAHLLAVMIVEDAYIDMA